MTNFFDDTLETPNFFDDTLDTAEKKDGPDFTRGLKESFQQLPQLGYGLMAGAGAVGEYAFGEGGVSTGIKKAGVKGYEDWGNKIAADSKPTDSLNYSWDRAKEGDIGALADWLSHGVGYVVGQGAQVLATGGVGALGGKLAAKTVAKEIADGMVAKEAAAITAEAAGKGIAEDQILKAATARVANKFATIGQTTALAANATGMEGGEIFGGLTAENKDRVLTGEELSKAFGTTLAAGGLEFVGDKLGLDMMLGRSKLVKGAENMTGMTGRAVRGAIAGTVAAPLEAGTEYFQTGLEEYGKGVESTPLPFNQSQRGQNHAFDAAALGALGGSVIGTASGAIRTPKPIAAATTVDEALDSFQAATEAGKAWQDLGIDQSTGSLETQRLAEGAGSAFQNLGIDQGTSDLATQRRDALIADVGQQYQDLGITDPQDALAAQKRISEVGNQWQGIEEGKQARFTNLMEEIRALQQRRLDAANAAGQEYQNLGITDPLDDLAKQKQEEGIPASVMMQEWDQRRRDNKIAQVGQQYRDLGITDPQADLEAQRKTTQAINSVGQQSQALGIEPTGEVRRIVDRFTGMVAMPQKLAESTAVRTGGEVVRVPNIDKTTGKPNGKFAFTVIPNGTTDRVSTNTATSVSVPGDQRTTSVDAGVSSAVADTTVQRGSPTDDMVSPAGLPNAVSDTTLTDVQNSAQGTDTAPTQTPGETPQAVAGNATATTGVPATGANAPVVEGSGVVAQNVAQTSIPTQQLSAAANSAAVAQTAQPNVQPTNTPTAPQGAPSGVTQQTADEKLQSVLASRKKHGASGQNGEDADLIRAAATQVSQPAQPVVTGQEVTQVSPTFDYIKQPTGTVLVKGDPAEVRKAFPGAKGVTKFADGKPEGVLFGVKSATDVVTKIESQKGNANAYTPDQAIETQPETPTSQAATDQRLVPVSKRAETTPEDFMAQELERLYQADVKESIKQRLGLSKVKYVETKQHRPFRDFLRKYGINSALSKDIVDNAFRANNALPKTFRKDGLNLDDLVTRAVESGFLLPNDIESNTDNGGTNRLIEMIQAEIRGTPQMPISDATEDAEKQKEDSDRADIENAAKRIGLPYDQQISTDKLASMVNRVTRKIEQTPTGMLKPDRIAKNALDAAMRIEQKRAELEAASQAFEEASIKEQDGVLDVLMDADGYPVIVLMSDAEANRKWYEQNPTTRINASPDQNEGQARAPDAIRADEGVGLDREVSPGTQRQDTQEGLESYTEADIQAEQARIAQIEKSKAKADQDAEAKAKADRIAKEIQQRQDASAENFQLGQSAEDALAGQGDIFDAPVSKTDTIESGDFGPIYRGLSNQPEKAIEKLMAEDEGKFAGTGKISNTSGLTSEVTANGGVVFSQKPSTGTVLQSDTESKSPAEMTAADHLREAARKMDAEQKPKAGQAENQVVASDTKTNDEPIPAITEAQARKQFEWRNMGQKDNTKTHFLFFFEQPQDKGTGAAMRRGAVELYDGASGWKIEDGDGTAYKSLADAKAAAIDAAIPILQEQGYVLKTEAQPAAQDPIKPSSLSYTPASKIDTPAQGVLANAIERKERAYQKLKSVRAKLNNGTANALDVLKAETAHKEELRFVEDARAQIEIDANKQGLTTIKPDPDTDTGIAMFKRSVASVGGVSTKITAGQEVEFIRKLNLKLLGTGNTVHLVKTFGDLPVNVQKVSSPGDMGITFDRGDVYIIQDNIHSAEDFEATVIHELYGHIGLRSLFGADLYSRLHKLSLSLGDTKIGELIKKYKLDANGYVKFASNIIGNDKMNRKAGGQDQLRKAWLMEEVLAHIAENETGSLKQMALEIIGAIKAWLRDNGFVQLAKLDMADIAYILKRARQEAFSTQGVSDLPAFSRKRIVGDKGRVYTTAQLQAMDNTGARVDEPTLKERAQALTKDLGKKLAQGIADQFAPVKALDGTAYGLLRLAKGASGAFEVLLQGGKLKLTDNVYDIDTAALGGVVDELLKPLGGEHHDFFRWVAAHRAEALGQVGKENLFTAADIAAFKTLANGTTNFDYTIKNGARRGQVTRDRTLIYNDSQTTFKSFNKNVLDMAEQSGLIDGATRHLWEGEFYVPFYRVADDADGGVRGMNIKGSQVRQEAFKKLKGGKNVLNADLLENTLMNWAHLLDASAKNRAAKATIDAAEAMGIATTGDQATLSQIGSSIHNKNGVVWFMDGGQKRYSLIDNQGDGEYIMTALSALEYAGMRNPVMSAMSAMKHALTLGVTASPFFKIKNLIRDSVQVIGTGQIGYNPAANVKQGWALTDPKSDAYFRLLAGGGTIHFGTMMEGSEAKRVQALVDAGVDQSTILNNPAKIKTFYNKVVKGGWEAYNEIGNRGEAVNRAALYDQLRKQGVNHAEASLQARDLMDFSMQGSWTSVRFLTQVVPFMNARIQGLYKLGRASKEDPARIAAVIGATTLFSLALLAAYSDDDDWKKRTDSDRNNFWWFKFGGTAYRIPKPFEIGSIATLAERGFELAFDKEMTSKQFMKNVKELLGDNLSMNPVPQLVKPLLDVYANRDSFSGMPIENMAQERLKSEYRFNDRTSMFARGASTALNKAADLVGGDSLSPVQIDHVLRGYFGWLGTFVVSGADIIARPATGQATQATPDYIKMLSGNMVSDLRDAPSKYVAHMYDQAKVIEEAHATWRSLLKEGKTAEAKEFRDENTDLLKKYRSIGAVKRKESAFNERIRVIERSNMSADAKRDLIRSIRAQKDRAARQGI